MNFISGSQIFEHTVRAVDSILVCDNAKRALATRSLPHVLKMRVDHEERCGGLPLQDQQDRIVRIEEIISKPGSD
jgi:hypothetical protein